MQETIICKIFPLDLCGDCCDILRDNFSYMTEELVDKRLEIFLYVRGKKVYEAMSSLEGLRLSGEKFTLLAVTALPISSQIIKSEYWFDTLVTYVGCTGDEYGADIKIVLEYDNRKQNSEQDKKVQSLFDTNVKIDILRAKKKESKICSTISSIKTIIRTIFR